MRVFLVMVMGTVLLGGGAQAVASVDRDTAVAVRGKAFNGSADVMTGRVRVSTPEGFRRTSANGARTAQYSVQIAEGCTAELVAAVRGVATSLAAREQVRRALVHTAASIAEGKGTAGPWEMGRYRRGSRGKTTLYGISVARVQARRFAQLRLLGVADPACTDQQLHSTAFRAAVGAFLRTPRVQVGVQQQ